MIDRAALRAATYYRDGRLYWASRSRGRRKDAPLGGALRNGYPCAKFQQKLYSLHKLIWAWHHDSDPPMINHINEDRTDNRIENLEASNGNHNQRHSSRNQNAVCIHRNGSGFLGEFRFKGQRYRTPTVKTIEQAQTLLKQLEEKVGYYR